MSRRENETLADANRMLRMTSPLPTEPLGWEAELARQVAREMSYAYESILELDPGLHAVGTPRAAGGPAGSAR